MRIFTFSLPIIVAVLFFGCDGDANEGPPGEPGPQGEQGPPGTQGLQGQAGADGASGLNSLVEVSDEEAGENCTTGGKKIEVGIDSNRNGFLDQDEVDIIEYVCNGEQGPQGDQDTPEQVLAKLLQVDGDGSELDADMLDSYQASDFLDPIQQLEQTVTGLETTINQLSDELTALQITQNDHSTQLQEITQRLQARHSELLFAWDGDGRYLGPLLSMASGSIVFYDVQSNMLVEAFLSNWGGAYSTNQERNFWYQSNDCSGPALMQRYRASQHMGVLDQRTGKIFTSTDVIQSVNTNSFYPLWQFGPPCSIAGGNTEYVVYDEVRTINPFTPGVFVAPMPW